MIQSISDIITNSSSEVFIINSHDHETVSKFLKDMCYICGVKMDDVMDMNTATEDSSLWYKGPKIKKGNLVIESTCDNSIPVPIMDLMENLDWVPILRDKVTKVQRYFEG